MIKEFFEHVIGGKSMRFQFTIFYASIYIGLALVGKLDTVAFATFSGVIGIWITSETYRKTKVDNTTTDKV